MKLVYSIVFAGSVIGAISATPKFVTGNMIDRRNGLTDAQYEYLWSVGKNPQIDQKTARAWIYRSGRYQNVTNWLDICGKTNNFAALSFDLQGKNFVLEDTNKVLKVEVKTLVSSNAVLEVDAKVAQKIEKSAAKAAKKDQKNFEKWIKDTKKARDKSSEDMREFYDSILEIAERYIED